MALHLPSAPTATSRGASVPTFSSTDPLASEVPEKVTPLSRSPPVMMLSSAMGEISASAGGVLSKVMVVCGRMLCTPLCMPTTSMVLLSARPVAGSSPALGLAVCRFTAQLPEVSDVVV